MKIIWFIFGIVIVVLLFAARKESGRHQDKDIQEIDQGHVVYKRETNLRAVVAHNVTDGVVVAHNVTDGAVVTEKSVMKRKQSMGANHHERIRSDSPKASPKKVTTSLNEINIDIDATAYRDVHLEPSNISGIDVSCNNKRPPEIHAFVLWKPSLWESQLQIIRDSELEIVDMFQVEKDHYKWCLNIYGSTSNVKHHGNCKKYGNPKVVVVKDNTPI